MTAVGDLLVEFKERPAAGELLPVLTLTERNGFVRQAERFKKRLATEDTSTYKVVRRNDIAFNPYLLWAGAVAQNTIVEAGVISPLYPTFRVREGHDRRFVARLLLSPQMIRSYDGIAFGSVPRRRRSSVTDFLGLSVGRVPAREEQRRIAAILDHADALRAKRTRVRTMLDALEGAVFFQMFGDPMVDDGEHGRAEIGAVARVVTGNSPPRSQAGSFGDAIEWIKSGDLGGRLATEAEERLSESGRVRARVAPQGSVLVTCIAGSRSSIGKASMVEREVAFNQQINAVLPTPHLEPEFLLAQLVAAPELVRARSTGGMKGLVNKTAFEGISILVPPLVKQREFTRASQAIQSQRAAAENALAADDELFASLQARAFDGRL